MVVSSNPLCLCEFQFTSQFIILVTFMLWTHFISILYNMGLGTIIKNLILNLLSHSGWKYEFCFCFKNMVKGCFCLEKVLQIIWKICILTLTQKTLFGLRKLPDILQHILLKSMPARFSLQESCRNRKRIGNKVHGSLYRKKSIFLLKQKIVLSFNWLIRTLKNEFLICDCIC